MNDLNMLLSCFRTKMSDKVATLPPEVDEDEDCVEPDGEGAADTADEYSDSPSDEPVTVVETEEYKAGRVEILKSQNHNKIEVGYSGQIRFWPTLWIKRIEHRKWNRGRNRLPKLVQAIAPSIPFPVFNLLYPQGKRQT